MNKFLRYAIFLFVLLLSLFFAGKHLAILKNDGSLSIPKNTNADVVASKLLKQGSSSFLTSQIFARLISKNAQIGIYEYKKGETIFQLSQRIKKGLSKVCKFTFIPGLTVYQYIQELNANEYFTGEVTVDVREGEILPETYSFSCLSSKNSVIIYAKQQMQNFLSKSLEGINFKTFYLKNQQQVLTLASIVEKETSIESERKIVASVFKNRLKKKMRLQTDPTVIYQQSQGRGFLDKPLTKVDLQTKGDYNTYQMDGLPIAPISNPSKNSILAVLNPSETPYLYFVAKTQNPQEGHNFAQTYEEHLRFVKAYRGVPRGTPLNKKNQNV